MDPLYYPAMVKTLLPYLLLRTSIQQSSPEMLIKCFLFARSDHVIVPYSMWLGYLRVNYPLIGQLTSFVMGVCVCALIACFLSSFPSFYFLYSETA